MSLSAYIRHLASEDIEQGGPMKIRASVDEPRADDLDESTFISFSSDSELERLIKQRASELRMSRSWYIRSLIRADSRAGGDLVISERSGPEIPDRTGRKPEKMPCEVCGSPDSHAHHPDYDYPLMVAWLCPAHHRDLHKLFRAS